MSDLRARGQNVANKILSPIKTAANQAGKAAQFLGNKTVAAGKTIRGGLQRAGSATMSAARTAGSGLRSGAVATKDAGVAGAKAVGKGAGNAALMGLGAADKGVELTGKGLKKTGEFVGKKGAEAFVALDEAAYHGTESAKKSMKKAVGKAIDGLEKLGEAESKAAGFIGKQAAKAKNAVQKQYAKSRDAGDNALGLKSAEDKGDELMEFSTRGSSVATEGMGKIKKGLYKVGEAQVAAIGTGVRAGKATLAVLKGIKNILKDTSINSLKRLENAINKTGLPALLIAERSVRTVAGKLTPNAEKIRERANRLLEGLKSAGQKLPGVTALLGWIATRGVKADLETSTQFTNLVAGNAVAEGSLPEGWDEIPLNDDNKTNQTSNTKPYVWDPNAKLEEFTYNDPTPTDEENV